MKRTERGWPGHFIAAGNYLFRRNTLLEHNGVHVVVSTVGNYCSTQSDEILPIGYNRYYETMAFHSMAADVKYRDADVHREIRLMCDTALSSVNVDDLANDMHETAVAEIISRLETGR